MLQRKQAVTGLVDASDSPETLREECQNKVKDFQTALSSFYARLRHAVPNEPWLQAAPQLSIGGHANMFNDSLEVIIKDPFRG